MRWPPFLGSKFPNVVTAHMPKARLAKSVLEADGSRTHVIRGGCKYAREENSLQ